MSSTTITKLKNILNTSSPNLSYFNWVLKNSNINDLMNASNKDAAEILRGVASANSSKSAIASSLSAVLKSALSSKISNADVGEALTIVSRDANLEGINAIVDSANINQLGNVTNYAAAEVLRTVAHGTDLGYSQTTVVNTIKNILTSPLSSRISNADVGEALTIASRNGDFDVVNALVDNANVNQLGNVTSFVANEVIRTAAHADEYGASVQKMIQTIDNILSSPLAWKISSAELKANNITYGTDGSETQKGTGAEDIMFGNGGNDVMFGYDGNDIMIGGHGTDTLYGGNGNDIIYTWKESSYNAGSTAGDIAYGGNGHDQIYGGTGNDKLYGQAGNDKLFGVNGDDYLYGNDGHDQLFGGGGNDRIDGGNGNDRLIGETGNDTLLGGAGNDILDGGSGKNVLYGGSGYDTFLFDTQALDGSVDVIKDYQVGERIDIKEIIDMIDPNIDLASRAIFDYIKVTTANGHKTLSVDLDGKGGEAAMAIVKVENTSQIDILVEQSPAGDVVHIF